MAQRIQRKIQLRPDEAAKLQQFTHAGTGSVREMTRAKVLLASNDGIPSTSISRVEGISRSTCYNVRKRYLDGGMAKALRDAPRPGAEKRLTVEEEAEVIATYCSDPPEGSAHWTMELLTEDFNTNHTKQVSKNTIWRVTLRSPEKPWRKKNVVHRSRHGGVPTQNVRRPGSIAATV